MVNHPNRNLTRVKEFSINGLTIKTMRTPGHFDLSKYHAKLFSDGKLICETNSPSEFEDILRVVVGNIVCHIIDY